MSTANKLTYLNATKQKLKQAINNLGGSIDDNTTFRQYANQLQGVYDNLPKTEYQEGTEINLGKTIKGKLDYENGVVGIGQTEQDGEPTPDTPIEIKSVTGNQDVVVKDGNNNTIATYQLSLGDIELNAIGNYKDELIYDVDEDRVYKNEKIGGITYNGSETWSTSDTSVSGQYRFTNNDISSSVLKPANNNTPVMALCNRLEAKPSNYTFTQVQGFSVNASGTLNLFIESLKTESVANFKTWLASNNMTFRYVKTQATEIPITDTTLINQVKALYNAYSNNGTTIITSNGDLPMIIKCRGLKGE